MWSTQQSSALRNNPTISNVDFVELPWNRPYFSCLFDKIWQITFEIWVTIDGFQFISFRNFSNLVLVTFSNLL